MYYSYTITIQLNTYQIIHIVWFYYVHSTFKNKYISDKIFLIFCNEKCTCTWHVMNLSIRHTLFAFKIFIMIFHRHLHLDGRKILNTSLAGIMLTKSFLSGKTITWNNSFTLMGVVVLIKCNNKQNNIVFGLREYQHIKHWITLNSLFELIGKIVQQTITQM